MTARRFLLLVVFLALVAFLIWRFAPRHPDARASTARARSVLIVTDTADTRDVPVWISGLGTVQAFNTVTVRPRVSGVLQKVNFTEGQSVSAGDVLAEIDPRPYHWALEQALAKRKQDAAVLANARLELDRTRGLVETNAESRQLLDQKESAAAQGEALVAADDAAIEAARLNVEFTSIRAPISGRTGVRLIDAGNLVTANQETGLVVLTQVQPVSVIFTVPQQQLAAFTAQLAPGAAPLKVQAIADDGSILAAGTLALIDNQIDAATGTLRLKATFANDPVVLWPGQFVNARVLLRTIPRAVTVATEAVRPGLDGPFVYVVKSDDTVEARPVTPGEADDARTVITRGLAPGEIVVREGHNKLEPGAHITVAGAKKKSAPAQP